jgi:hypothetical protein
MQLSKTKKIQGPEEKTYLNNIFIIKYEKINNAHVHSVYTQCLLCLLII